MSRDFKLNETGVTIRILTEKDIECYSQDLVTIFRSKFNFLKRPALVFTLLDRKKFFRHCVII